jgi:hypothetical protein
MPFEETRVRDAYDERARQARPRGEVPDQRFPVRGGDSDDVNVRENGIFDDMTGYTLTGFARGAFRTAP